MELRRVVVVALLAVACTSSSAPPQPAAKASAAPADAAVTMAAPDAAAAAPTPAAQETIGVATMEKDGTIVMDLRATGPGVTGDARILYPKDHKDYQKILDHLGGLAPGQTKPVPPFPSP